jgi:uncharacterized membrane protein YdjX (TVP38/TMEM64 family)
MNAGSKMGWMLIAIFVALFALAGAWHWTPMAKWVDVRALSEWMSFVRAHPLGPVFALAAYLAGSLVLFPIAMLIIATIFVYGPLLGFVYALLGSALAAALTYQIGHWLGYEAVRQIAGERMSRIRRAASSHGFEVAFVTHLVPVAPFTLVNMVAGAASIRFQDFALGTILGMIPGITAITLFERQLEHLMRNPGLESYALFGAVVALTAVATAWARRRLASFEDAVSISGDEKSG